MTSMAHSTSTAHDRHAGVDVFANRVLWDAITDCMTGYPRAVVDLIHTSRSRLTSKLNRAKDTLTPETARIVGHLCNRGELVHLAIAADDANMLNTLHRLSAHAQYERDGKLSFQKAMRCAVLCNDTRMLEHIVKLKLQLTLKRGSSHRCGNGRGSDKDNTGSGSNDNDSVLVWEPNLMATALMRSDPDARVLDWLVTHLPRASYALTHKSLVFHAKRGDLATVQWLHDHGRKLSWGAMDIAASNNRLGVLQYLYAHSSQRCSRDGACEAAQRGLADVVKHIVMHKKRHRHRSMIRCAASNGHLALVQLFLEHPEYKSSEYMTHAINDAARNGHAAVVQHLHEHFHANASTAYGLTSAATSGHLDVVKYLHEHRPSECCPNALGHAARQGHLAIVQYLHANSHATCAHVCEPSAFDRAAAGGHLDVVAYLHAHRSEGCTDAALTGAAKNGHADVVAFLLEHRREGAVLDALNAAAQHGHLAIVELLHSRLAPGESTLAAVSAAVRRQHHTIARFLCEHQAHESVCVLAQAVSSDAVYQVVKAAARVASVDELVEAKALAQVHGRWWVAEQLGFYLSKWQQQ